MPSPDDGDELGDEFDDELDSYDEDDGFGDGFAAIGDLLSGLGGGGAGSFGGIGDLFAQAQAAMSASSSIASMTIVGTSGGGVVRIVSSGAGDIHELTIAREVVDPDDVETLQDLIIAAWRDIQQQVNQLQAQAMGGFDPAAVLGGIFGGETDDGSDGDLDDDDLDDEAR